MIGPLYISSAFFNAFFYNQEVANLRILFAQGFNIQTADHDLLNKLVIDRFNQYKALNTKDYNFWNCIQIHFEKWKAKYFNKVDNTT